MSAVNMLEEVEDELKDNGHSLSDIFYVWGGVKKDRNSESMHRHFAFIRPETFIAAASEAEYDPWDGDPSLGIYCIDPLTKVVLKDGSFLSRNSDEVEFWEFHAAPDMNPVFDDDLEPEDVAVQWMFLKSGKRKNEAGNEAN